MKNWNRETRLLTVAYLTIAGSLWMGGRLNAQDQPVEAAWDPLPVGLTSFGAAIVDQALYVYGGHTGEAHSYSREEQSARLQRLELGSNSKWQTISEDQRLQGLALVPHGTDLIRIGGFSARNKEGEEADLQSTSSVRRFDTRTGTWTDLASLPEPRSSLDAVILGDEIYVVGGWSLTGGDKSNWLETAWSLDLSDASNTWTPLPSPPFRRRAIALAAHDGKVYALGGMNPDGPTTDAQVYDPATRHWSAVPQLPGKPFEGFGASAWSWKGQLFVSTNQGHLLRLTQDGDAWQDAGELQSKRLFHRMLPHAEGLILVGGVNMEEGKYHELELVIPLPSSD